MANPDGDYLLAALARGPEGARNGDVGFAARGPFREPGLSFGSRGFSARVWVSPAGSAAIGAGGDVLLALHGVVHTDGGDAPAARLVDDYVALGVDGLARGLRGSFALLVLDRRLDRAFLVTDPVNSRKLYHGHPGGRAWVSTARAVEHHPARGGALDTTGLAHHLVNGIPLGGRTLYEGLSVLPRASVHELRDRGWTSRPYWSFAFDGGAAVPESELGDRLEHALVSAVRRSLPDAGHVHLSLSAGYDSTCILGLLARLGAEDVRCFSYTKLPGGAADDDARTAGRMAARAGYRHTVVPGCGDDLATVLDDNARLGRGLARLVIETDAWRRVGDMVSSDGPATLWVGDECFGWTDVELRGMDDVFASLGIGSWRSLGWLGRLLPRRSAKTLGDALEEDLRALAAGAPGGDVHQIRDYLYLEQRLPRILSWRETFAGDRAGVRNPLLDRNVLDVVASLPTPLRRGKRLFRRTATRMFPELFEADRVGGTWSVPAWIDREVRRSRDWILASLAEPSPLDDVVPPGVLSRLARDELGAGDRLRRHATAARRTVGRARRRLSTGALTTSRATRPRKPAVAPGTFLLRSLQLRELLRRS